MGITKGECGGSGELLLEVVGIGEGGDGGCGVDGENCRI